MGTFCRFSMLARTATIWQRRCCCRQRELVAGGSATCVYSTGAQWLSLQFQIFACNGKLWPMSETWFSQSTLPMYNSCIIPWYIVKTSCSELIHRSVMERVGEDTEDATCFAQASGWAQSPEDKFALPR